MTPTAIRWEDSTGRVRWQPALGRDRLTRGGWVDVSLAGGSEAVLYRSHRRAVRIAESRACSVQARADREFRVAHDQAADREFRPVTRNPLPPGQKGGRR